MLKGGFGMKKEIKRILIFLIITTMLMACGKNTGDSESQNEAKENEETIWLLDKETKYTLSGNGVDLKLSGYKLYEYNSLGNETKLTEYDADGNQIYVEENEYINENAPKTKITYNNKGEVEKRQEYTFDTLPDPCKMEVVQYNGDDEEEYSMEIEFDKDGKPVNGVEYGYLFGTKIEIDVEIEYLGSNLKSMYLYMKGESGNRPVMELECDNNGNIINRKSYNFLLGTINSEVEIKYDSNNNKTEERKYDSSGEITLIKKYEYDENNNLIRTDEKDAEGELIDWIEYEYDENGNKIKETAIKANEEIIYVIEYEYSEAVLDLKGRARNIFDNENVSELGIF